MESTLKSNEAVKALAALAQETRLAIYRTLVQAGPTGLAAGEIAAAVGAPAATISFHLKELSHAGLVTSRSSGRYIFYSAQYDRMNELVQFLTENCCAADGTSCAPGCKPSHDADSTAARAAKPIPKTSSTKRRATSR
ncbi:MAG TPA: metalloregulator ArsR/SmtB family transcription factor [Burkholderiaceae bacterium]|nr:metalloregulator ArsR/SmtB family transcription factor [Burkholderiaceae bacterium]